MTDAPDTATATTDTPEARMERRQQRLDSYEAHTTWLLSALALVYLFTLDRKSTRLNSSHSQQSRMPSSA